MNIEVNLPYKFIANSLGELAFIESSMRHIIPDFHIREVGFVGYHVGLAYVGELTDPANIDQWKELEQELALDIAKDKARLNNSSTQETQ